MSSGTLINEKLMLEKLSAENLPEKICPKIQTKILMFWIIASCRLINRTIHKTFVDKFKNWRR